jgi:cell division protein FtsQ
MATQNRRGANRQQQAAPGRFDRLIDSLSRVFTLTLLVAVVYGSSMMFREVDQPVTEILVAGELTYMQQQELVDLVSTEIDGGFLTIDLDHLRQVLQDHPWVDLVSIRRQWPSTLSVEVVEEVPIARWGEEGFLNRLGEELNIADNSALADLPVLRAQYGSSKEMMKSYQMLAQLLLPTGLKLAELQRDNLGVWRVSTVRGIELVLGRDQLGDKLKRLALAWESGLKNELQNIATIDLRYPNGLAVAWKDGLLASAQNHLRENADLPV